MEKVDEEGRTERDWMREGERDGVTWRKRERTKSKGTQYLEKR